MTTINVYLTFNGNCLEAFEFYKSVFGGEYSYIGKFGEMPPDENYQVPESDKNRIMHVSLPISQETILMGSDSSSYSGDAVFGNNFSVSINTGSKDEADRLFNSLSAGGKVIMPLSETFWGAYFGMFTDKFGVNWMVNHDIKQN
ncbi:MAG: VOC family protein [Ignavibacteriaceae bacterium]|nr:VOC family protein [Ignavibacteriaceae bacterium]